MSIADAPVMLIAGGSGSIGRAVAGEAVRQGWRVIGHGRNEERLFELTRALDATGETAATLALDVIAKDGAANLVEQAAQMFGRLDAVVDCVSTGVAGSIGPFASTDPDVYDDALGVSLGHVQRLAHASLPWLAVRGGTFIAFASDAGRHAAPNQTIIGASRAGIIGFIRNLAVEVARDGVRAHCISPSFVADSDSARRLSPRGEARYRKAANKAGLGLPSAEDIAPLVLFLCSNGATKMTGQVLSVNGGLNS